MASTAWLGGVRVESATRPVTVRDGTFDWPLPVASPGPLPPFVGIEALGSSGVTVEGNVFGDPAADDLGPVSYSSVFAVRLTDSTGTVRANTLAFPTLRSASATFGFMVAGPLGDVLLEDNQVSGTGGA